jgi:hypothetical protein
VSWNSAPRPKPFRSNVESLSNIYPILPAAFVRDLVTCLGKLLLAQEVASGVWSAPGTLKTFYVLLSCFREKCVGLARPWCMYAYDSGRVAYRTTSLSVP